MNTQTQTYTILIAEDEELMRTALIDAFQLEGFTVFAAKDGQEAFDITQKQTFDVALLDILMPKLDGLSLMKKIREIPFGKNIPIIILTNVDPDDKTLQTVLEEHASYYLLKSDITVAKVIEKVRDVLGKK